MISLQNCSLRRNSDQNEENQEEVRYQDVQVQKIPLASNKIIEESLEYHFTQRKWKGVKEISLNVNDETDIHKKLREISEQIDNAVGYQIKFKVFTYFSSNKTALSFSKIIQFAKKNIFYFEWKVFGQNIDQWAQVVGEVIGQFSQIFSLVLYLDREFGDQSTSSLIESFSKLKSIHILKLCYLNKSDQFMNDKSRKELIQAMQSLTTLEILEQNIDIESQTQKLEEEVDHQINGNIQNLSNFYYPYFCNFDSYNKGRQEEMRQQFIKSIHKNQNMISSINIVKSPQLNLYGTNFDFFEEQIALCLKLPYLTKFNDQVGLSLTNRPIYSLLNSLIEERNSKIQQIVMFKHYISSHLPFNPVQALSDFYF